MRAKILHAERKTEDTLEIYKTKFTYRALKDGRRAELLKNPAYTEVLNKYR